MVMGNSIEITFTSRIQASILFDNFESYTSKSSLQIREVNEIHAEKCYMDASSYPYPNHNVVLVNLC